MLVDEKLHNSITRRIHSSFYHEYFAGHHLSRTPSLLRVWHPYTQMSIIRYPPPPLMQVFIHDIVTLHTPMHLFPKLILMERMFACLFVFAPSTK